jgi:hypothetical protein
MLIAPAGDALAIQAKVAPQDIDHGLVGQTARVRFTAFGQRAMPEFNGEVSLISPDATREQQTNQEYIVSLKLMPGMPAEVFIKTTERAAVAADATASSAATAKKTRDTDFRIVISTGRSRSNAVTLEAPATQSCPPGNPHWPAPDRRAPENC